MRRELELVHVVPGRDVDVVVVGGPQREAGHEDHPLQAVERRRHAQPGQLSVLARVTPILLVLLLLPLLSLCLGRVSPSKQAYLEVFHRLRVGSIESKFFQGSWGVSWGGGLGGGDDGRDFLVLYQRGGGYLLTDLF